MNLKEKLANYSRKWTRLDRVYIFPTKFGLYFAGLIFVCFMIALTYGNNTLLLITFILLAQYITLMIWAHFNLNSAKLTELYFRDGHAGENARGHCQFDQNGRFQPREIALKLEEIPLAISDRPKLIEIENSIVGFNYNMIQRNYIHLSECLLYSTFPLSLFRTWKYVGVQASCYIYPKAEGNPLLELISSELTLNGQLFKHHSKYDGSITRVDWKKYAKSDVLLNKIYESEDIDKIEFEFIPEISRERLEGQLSQYALWIREAQQLSMEWHFRGPNIDLGSNDKNAHTILMRYLACFKN